MALSCVHMKPHRAIWTHLKRHSMIDCIKVRHAHLTAHMHIWHIKQSRSQKVHMGEPDFCQRQISELWDRTNNFEQRHNGLFISLLNFIFVWIIQSLLVVLAEHPVLASLLLCSEAPGKTWPVSKHKNKHINSDDFPCGSISSLGALGEGPIGIWDLVLLAASCTFRSPPQILNV